jgi:hypothetical protein
MVAAMGEGRLIRVGKSGGKSAASYIVNEADKTTAIDIVRKSIVSLSDDIQDLGRVSEELLKAMSVEPGEFVSVDGVQHISQQQQQPQPK